MSSSASGIYLVRNTLTGDRYVGSAVHFGNRWIGHKSALRSGRHANRYLQAAWAKYGEECFAFSVLEAIDDPATLFDREQSWLDELKPEYNICADVRGRTGVPHLPETRAKIGAGRKGKTVSPEAKARMSAAQKKRYADPEQLARLRGRNIGRQPSEETRAKLSAAQKGRKYGSETRANMSKAQKGRIITPEVREKIRQKLTGTTLPEETKEKIRATLKGRQFTPEWRAKISAAMRSREWPPLAEEHKARIGKGVRQFLSEKQESICPREIAQGGDVSDAEWEIIRSILPRPNQIGRPPQDMRPLLNGILWWLGNHDAVCDLIPRVYGAPDMCGRYLSRWRKGGEWSLIVAVLTRSRSPVNGLPIASSPEKEPPGTDP